MHMYVHTCVRVYDLHVRFFILPWRTLYVSTSLCVYFCSSVASVSKMPNTNICFVLRFWATGKQHCMLGICMMGVWLFVRQHAHAHIQRALMSLIEPSTHMTLSMGLSH